MSTPRQQQLQRFWRRTRRYRPATVTGAIIAVTVAVYALESALLLAARYETNPVVSALAYAPVASTGGSFQPWRALTAALVHAPIGPGAGIIGVTHILFNMYALYLLGRPLESLFGGVRLLVLYLLSVLGGSVAVLYVAFALPETFFTPVIGASGGVFGLFAATFVAQRRLGGDVRPVLLVIAVNLGITFVLPNIAWQAHLGGLVAGALAGWILIANRGPRRNARQAVLLGVLAAVLVVLLVLPRFVVF